MISGMRGLRGEKCTNDDEDFYTKSVAYRCRSMLKLLQGRHRDPRFPAVDISGQTPNAQVAEQHCTYMRRASSGVRMTARFSLVDHRAAVYCKCSRGRIADETPRLSVRVAGKARAQERPSLRHIDKDVVHADWPATEQPNQRFMRRHSK